MRRSVASCSTPARRRPHRRSKASPDTPYWTNRDILRIESVPGSLAVIGGGPIGAELAQGLARFGVRVTVLEVGDRILGPEDPRAAGSSRTSSPVRGSRCSPASRSSRCRTTTAASASPSRTTKCSMPRSSPRPPPAAEPNLPDLGLETVGLDPSAHSIDVDERMRAGEGLWALGDVVGKGAFTHVSMYQSAICVRDILGEEGRDRRLPGAAARDLHRPRGRVGWE